MNKKQDKIPIAKPRYRVGHHVRISKEKMEFAKGGKQNYSTEVFRIIKVIRRTPRPVYELEDLIHKVKDGHFFNEELTPIRITNAPRLRLIKF